MYPKQHYDLSLPAPTIVPAPEQSVAGIAVRDITPPPGFPKFGYSGFAKDGNGFRTRLKARAFYLHAPQSAPVVLVQLDLAAGSLLLHHLIAQRIAAQGIPAHQLTLLATHTHTGPGQYLASDFYNRFGSNRAGLDPQLVEFLVSRITEAILAAQQNRKPARFATGQTQIFGATRNRSIQAWATNWGLKDEDIGEHLAYQAINPTMTMVRIDQQQADGEFHPAGALTAFSIHGTAIPAFTSPYHGDIWATMERALPEKLSDIVPEAHTPYLASLVHAPFQATHGDNNPAIEPGRRGHLESQRIGQLLAGKASQLFNQLETQLTSELKTTVISQRFDLLQLNQDEREGLCERAIIGASTSGAANGDEVFPISYLPLLQEDWPRSLFTDGCQGEKQWMLSKLQLLLPADRFPHHALLQTIQINNLLLIALPWEVTLESGNIIREAVRSALPETLRHAQPLIEVSSVANGYFGYVTTPAEYSRQFYEGGHTLYGPGTLHFLARKSADLAWHLDQQESLNLIPASLQLTLAKAAFWPEKNTTPSSTRQLVTKPTWQPPTANRQGYWYIRYHGSNRHELALHRPLLSVTEVLEDGQEIQIADDQGTQMQLIELENSAQGSLYEARWYHMPVNSERQFRFHVQTRATMKRFHSPVFPE